LPFGAYGGALIGAIQNRWFALLDERRFAGRHGQVIVTFKLHADGSVRIIGAPRDHRRCLAHLLCVRAVRDPAPYEKWPSDAARMVGNVREMRFTFF
jgi:hypothetical protein